MIIIKKQIEIILTSTCNAICRFLRKTHTTINYYQPRASIYHHRKPSKRMQQHHSTNAKVKTFFRQTEFLREWATVPWLEEEEEGILPSLFLRRLPCARARLNHIDLLPTWLIGNHKHAFHSIAVQCMHAYTHTRTYMCVRALPSVELTYIV